MSKGLFITATGTDIGKTYVTGLLVKALRQAGLNAGYYKAALSGAEKTAEGLIPGDAAFVAQTAALDKHPSSLVSYIYEHAVSPHLAAAIEGNPVEMEQVKQDFYQAAAEYDYLTMEGSGGIICPIRWDDKKIMLEDIVKELQLGTIVISTAALGSINACVLTVSYLQQQNIPVRGIIINNYDADDIMQQDNKKMIAELTGIPVIGTVAPHAEALDIDIDLLKSLYGTIEERN